MLSITSTAKKGDRAILPRVPSRHNIVKYFSRCISFKYEIINYEKEETTSELCWCVLLTWKWSNFDIFGSNLDIPITRFLATWVTSVVFGQSAEWLKLTHPTCDFSGDEETGIMGTAKWHLRLRKISYHKSKVTSIAMKSSVSRQQQSYFYGDEDVSITTTAQLLLWRWRHQYHEKTKLVPWWWRHQYHHDKSKVTSMVVKTSVPRQQHSYFYGDEDVSITIAKLLLWRWNHQYHDSAVTSMAMKTSVSWKNKVTSMVMKTSVPRQKQSYFYGDEDISTTTKAKLLLWWWRHQYHDKSKVTSMAMKTSVPQQKQSYFYGDEDISITTAQLLLW